MKKFTILMAFILLFSFVFSFAAAEEEVSLGALLYHENAVLFDSDGVTITITAIIQDIPYSPEIILKADCTSDLEHPVLIWFTLPNQTDQDPFSGFILNGQEFYGSAQSRDEEGGLASGIYIPAKGKSEAVTIFMLPEEMPQDEVYLSYKDVTEGSFCITIFRPSTDKSEESFPGWAVLAVHNPVPFNMSYDGPVSEEKEMAIPPLDAFTEGTEIFSFDGVTLTCLDADYGMDMDFYRFSLMGHAVLRNDTDHDFTLVIYDTHINGGRNGAFSLTPEDGSSVFPAHSETECTFSMPLNEGMDPEEYASLSMILCCKDPETGKNLIWQPVLLTVTQPE